MTKRKAAFRCTWEELFDEVMRLRQQVDALQDQAAWSANRAQVFSEALHNLGVDPRLLTRDLPC